MAIAVRSVATGTDGTHNPVSVSAPAGVQASDLLVAVQFVDVFGTTAAMTADVGWTQTGTTYASGTTGNGSCHAKVWTAPGSTSAPYTFGNDLTSCVTVLAVTGYDAFLPIDITPTYSQGSSNQTSQDAPTISPTGAASLLICAFATTISNGTGPPTYAAPSGMTEQSDLSSGFAISEVDTQVLSGSGATGAKTATVTLNGCTINEYTSLSLALAVSTGIQPPPRKPVFVGPGMATTFRASW